MLCEIAGIEPTYRTMNPIKQVLRSSQTGALCLKHKKINEEIFSIVNLMNKSMFLEIVNKHKDSLDKVFETYEE